MKNSSIPVSYKDPFWSSLSSSSESKFGLPEGLLNSIVTHGERSNADQVSEYGAKTPFQIIPQTRDAILKKYGIDAYSGPESAADAAGILLKESLQRNQGDVASAIAEYHGGTDRNNWGNKTKDYVNRVYDGLMKVSYQPEHASSQDMPTISEGGQISTFRRSLGDGGNTNIPPIQDNALAKVYAAYQSGKMTPEEAREFEEDIRSGSVMVPGVDISNLQSAKNAQSNSDGDNMSPTVAQNATVQNPTTEESSVVAKNTTTVLPQSVIQAYQSGRMNEVEMKELENDIANGLVSIPQGSELKKPEGPGTLAKIADTFTGNLRETSETNNLKDWAGMPELNSFTIPGLKTGIGTLMSNPQETVQVIQANFPEVQVRQDEKGNFILRSSMDGQEYAIKPGFQISDIPRAGAALASFTPAGRVATIPGAVAASAGTQAAIEASQGATGGDVDAGEIATAGLLGGAANLVSRGVNAASSGIRNLVSKTDEVIPPTNTIVEPQAQRAPLSGEELAQTTKQAASRGFGAKAAANIVAEQAAPDEKVLDAAKRLGIEDYLQPDHLTSNQAYRELAQALKSVPGSASRSVELEGLQSIGKRANDLIDEIGGTTDLSQLNQNVRSRFEKDIGELETSANKAYDDLRKNIPLQTRESPNNVLEFIAQRAQDLDGVNNLSSLEKAVFHKLSPKRIKDKDGNVIGEKAPTYALIDDVRRDIGAAARQRGPFADADIGLAKKLYSLIDDDQFKMVERLGMGEQYKVAKGLVSMRKGIEDDMASLLGKQIDQSLVGKLSTATKALSSGDAQKFVNVIKAIPEDMRKSVVASSLNTAFGRATRDGALNFNSYAKWYEGVAKNKQAYAALMSNLPPSSRKKLSDLYRVAKNISLATRERITTGRIQAVKDEFQDADTIIGRIYDLAKRSSIGVPLEAFTTSIGLPGAGIASGVASALSRSTSKPLEAADKLLASPEFQKLIARKNSDPELIKKIASSNIFNNFAKSINMQNNLNSREKFIINLIQSEKQFDDKGQ